MSARRSTARRTTRSRTGLVAVAGLAALGLTATACGGSGSSSSSEGLVLLAVQDSPSLDPFHASYQGIGDGQRMAALYEPLVYSDAATGDIKPQLAESLTSADQGRTWTLKLRPGVKFSDGTPFDAAAVKLNWETHAKPETKSIEQAYATGLKLTVQDPQTLLVAPPTPNPNFDRTVARNLTYIEAPSAINKGLTAAGNQPIGAGPFKLDSWTRGSQQVFVKNDNYWQKDKGLPKVDKLTIKNVPDIQQEYNTVKSGGADIFGSSDQATLARAKEELQATQNRYTGGQYIQFNLRKAPFNDVRARRAIALALDPADVPRTLNNGYVPAKGFFPESSPFFDPSAVQPAPNHDEAQRLFNELAAEGKKVDFSYLIPQNPTSQAVAQLMQSRLAQYQNVSMKIDSVEIGAYITKFAIQKDFQAMLYSQMLTDPEPGMYAMFFSSSHSNYPGWSNPQADAALAAGRASTDPAARKKAYGELQKAMSTDLPVFVYSQADAGVIFAKSVSGVQLYDDGVLLMDRITKN